MNATPRNLHRSTDSGDDADVDREKVITIRLTDNEYKRWTKAAGDEDRTLSNWIRRQCNAAATVTAASIVGTDLEEELVARAIKTYSREASDQPSNASSVEDIGGKPYVVLRNVRGDLAYYQIVLASDGKYKLKPDAAVNATLKPSKKGGK